MLVPSKIIKTANLFENIYGRCGAGLQPGASPIVSFPKIFSIGNTYFQQHLSVCVYVCVFFFFCNCNVSSKNLLSLCFHLFLQTIRHPKLFSTSWLLLTVIDKFANRNRSGYCFRYFGKFPQEHLQWSSQ